MLYGSEPYHALCRPRLHLASLLSGKSSLQKFGRLEVILHNLFLGRLFDELSCILDVGREDHVSQYHFLPLNWIRFAKSIDARLIWGSRHAYQLLSVLLEVALLDLSPKLKSLIFVFGFSFEEA